MATSAALISQTLLQLGNGVSPQVFTTIGEVRTIGGLGARNELIEVTHMLSTAKEYISGLPDGKEISFTVNYIPTNSQHVALLVANAAKTQKDFRLVLPSTMGSKVFSFSALVIDWELPAPSPNEAYQMTYVLKITGSILGPN